MAFRVETFFLATAGSRRDCVILRALPWCKERTEIRRAGKTCRLRAVLGFPVSFGEEGAVVAFIVVQVRQGDLTVTVQP